MPQRAKTLLSPANPEWSRLDREKRELLRPPADAAVEDLLRQGMRLSAQAMKLAAAIEPGADGRAAAQS